MEKDDWGPRLVKVIAGQVRYWRDERDISAQTLANRCAALGWPIKRSVLSNLEGGYREVITVPEVLTLAAALEISPLELLVPLGRAESVEVLPGNSVSTADAMRWVVGDAPLPESKWDSSPNGRRVVVESMDAHQRAVEDWRSAVKQLRDLHGSALPSPNAAMIEFDARLTDAMQASIDHALTAIRHLRARMRAEKITPPALPPDLDGMDV